MSTLSNEETSCLEDQVRHSTAGLSWDHLIVQTRMVLAEVHTGAGTYKTMQELSGTKNAIKLGGTGVHLTDTTLRRRLANTMEQERPRHLWLSLRCISYCTPVQTEHNKLTTAQKQTEREKKETSTTRVQGST